MISTECHFSLSPLFFKWALQANTGTQGKNMATPSGEWGDDGRFYDKFDSGAQG